MSINSEDQGKREYSIMKFLELLGYTLKDFEFTCKAQTDCVIFDHYLDVTVKCQCFPQPLNDDENLLVSIDVFLPLPDWHTAFFTSYSDAMMHLHEPILLNSVVDKPLPVIMQVVGAVTLAVEIMEFKTT